MKNKSRFPRWELTPFLVLVFPLKVLATASIDPCPPPIETIVASTEAATPPLIPLDDRPARPEDPPSKAPRPPRPPKVPPPQNVSTVKLPQDVLPERNPPVPVPGDAPVPGAPPDSYRSDRGAPVPPMTVPQ